jgi:crossover junction endodeoxyribonuclease RuvC
MRVFGIDCGTEFTGYGMVEALETPLRRQLVPLRFGAICLEKKHPLPQRLIMLYSQLTALLAELSPDVVAIEEVFYSVNAKSALKLGQVRGVALLAAASAGLPIAEYAPLAIKSAVVGYGLAQKTQVQFMVARLLDMAEPPSQPDAADALAIAICHLHHAETAARQPAPMAAYSVRA